jgi:hypothetical protein|tara:strand:+ start:182 stop:412 length:231 start_codon:yes stop_codon:yes gene_type:complete
MDKKLTGAAAAVMGAFLYGGAQLLDMEERLLSLEEVCFPAEEEAVDEAAEEPQSEDKEAEEPAPEEPEEEGAPEEE